MKLCILCHLKLKDTVQSENRLDKLCTVCKQSNKVYVPKFDRQQIFTDPSNDIVAFTSTLKPKYHSACPTEISGLIRYMCKMKIQQARTPALISGCFEFTKQGVLHCHGYIVSRKSTMGNIFSHLRRFGFVRTEKIFDLEEWIKYMEKDQDEESPAPFRYTS